LPKQVTTNKLPKQVTPVTQIGILELPKQADTKETITKEIIQKKYTSIKSLTNDDFEKIAKKYNVPIGFVLSKYDDMVNWHESTGKNKKDWVATLRNFVKTDALKRIDYAKQSNNKRAIDASNI